MLYFRVLQQGLSVLPEADPALRRRLEGEMERHGLGRLHRRLAELDPPAAARIHPNDPQRILRALEVCELTGRPLSAQQGGGEAGLPYRVVKLARAPAERAVLHRRIEARFRQMLDQGLVEEVRGLLARGDLSPAMPSLRAVGYRQVVQHLLGEVGWEEMIEKGIVATRQLAKRQYTWLRAEPDLHWLDEAAGDLPGQALRLLRSRWGDPQGPPAG
jgi:tRNA dimethylallyltransferase